MSCNHPYGTVTPVTEKTTESSNAMQIGFYTFLLTSESVFLSNERMKWQRPMMISTGRMGILFVQHHWRESVTFKINLILLWKKWWILLYLNIYCCSDLVWPCVVIYISKLARDRTVTFQQSLLNLKYTFLWFRTIKNILITFQASSNIQGKKRKDPKHHLRTEISVRWAESWALLKQQSR